MSAANTPPSPSASFYDMSDDEEGEYNTITHARSGRGVKLLFSKSKVYVHPTPSAKDNIAGYVALMQQKPAPDSRPTSRGGEEQDAHGNRPAADNLLLAWLPETALGDAHNIYVKVDLDDAGTPPRQTYLVPPPPTMTVHGSAVGTYAFAVPVSDVFSLLVRPPSLGWWYGSLIINSRVGDSFPALFFHDDECQSTILQKKKRTRESFDPFGVDGQMFWGGDEVLRWLRKYVAVERSVAEPNIYLVEPTPDDKRAFCDPGTVDHIPQRPSARGMSVRGAAGSLRRPQIMPRARADAGMDPVTKFMKETSWNILEKFSKVTTFTRRTAQDVLDNPKLPPQMKRLLRNPEVQTIQDEFDSARIYLARWAMGIAEQSERERTQRIWTAKEVLETEETDVGDFELLETGSMTLKEQRRVVTLKEWNGFFDQTTGRLQVTPDEVKERIFHGGLDPNDGVRKEAWLFLLGVVDWFSTAQERRTELSYLRNEYVKLKGAWWDRLVDMGGPGEAGEWWREQKGRIEKDVHRTDRMVPIFAGEDIPHPDPDSPFADVGTNVHLEQMKDMLLTYNEYNSELGYVQGMSDLLAPIYAVLQDDAIAFWCFVHFMNRMERNFLRDQSGMRAQLVALDQLVQLMDPKLYLHLQSADSTNFFFFFRMLLVWYKREFEWMDVLRLWEGLWTDYYSSSFHLFVALAILEKHRTVIMDHLKQFDEVLKYINELSNTIELETILIRAEALFRRFQRTVEAIDKKDNFPPPQLRQRTGTASSGANSPSTGLTSSSDARTGASASPAPARSPQPSPKGKGRDDATPDEVKPISPQLRHLLSREVETVPHSVIVKKVETTKKAASEAADDEVQQQQ